MPALITHVRVLAVTVVAVLIAGCSGGAASPTSAPAPATSAAPAPTEDVTARVQAAVQATLQVAVPVAVQATLVASAPKATATPTPAPTPAIASLTNETWGLALPDASRYKDVPVSLVGKVFLDPQVSADVIAFQIYTNKDASDGNTIIVGAPTITVKKGDFVRIEGKVLDVFEGKNAFGAALRVPRVMATSVTVVSREDVVAPALKKYAVDQTQTQHGLAITLQKVELAAGETRVYVSVANQSPEKASVYTNSARLVQGSHQFEAKSLYDSGYPSMPTDLLGGVVASAVIVFDAVDANEGLRLVWDGPRAGSYGVKFDPYQWSVGG
jgi:hypothetical protein